ncbi:response regulator [Paenibacillus septentrionalis]|uniref:Response regulator n=1 Tax=Paenibacillus septentrionalis TaxID=429342 RepID=A0ABW1VB80_9BACL
MSLIFIVEDDLKIAQLLKAKLEQYSYEVKLAEDFRHISEEIVRADPHLILLDINLPYYDGYYWCRQVRKISNVPIIFISAREGEMDQVMAIENGGDDYITKPVRLELLVAKVRAQLRRAYGEYAAPSTYASDRSTDLDSLSQEQQQNGRIEVEGLVLWLNRNELHYKQQQIDITRNELLLLECLLNRYGEVVARDTLLETLWDDVQFVDDNTLTVNMTRLRKKMSELGLPDAIETIRGQGYKLKL